MHFLTTFARLRADASVEPLPVDHAFWPRLTSGALGDFVGEHLVACHDFNSDWTSWERHPAGDEIVVLLDGAAILVFERDGAEETATLTGNGAWVVVPRGVWHTARVASQARMLFITPGEGTENRAIA